MHNDQLSPNCPLPYTERYRRGQRVEFTWMGKYFADIQFPTKSFLCDNFKPTNRNDCKKYLVLDFSEAFSGNEEQFEFLLGIALKKLRKLTPSLEDNEVSYITAGQRVILSLDTTLTRMEEIIGVLDKVFSTHSIGALPEAPITSKINEWLEETGKSLGITLTVRSEYRDYFVVMNFNELRKKYGDFNVTDIVRIGEDVPEYYQGTLSAKKDYIIDNRIFIKFIDSKQASRKSSILRNKTLFTELMTEITNGLIIKLDERLEKKSNAKTAKSITKKLEPVFGRLLNISVVQNKGQERIVVFEMTDKGSVLTDIIAQVTEYSISRALNREIKFDKNSTLELSIADVEKLCSKKEKIEEALKKSFRLRSPMQATL